MNPIDNEKCPPTQGALTPDLSPSNPSVKQSEELTHRVNEGEASINGGVGPQPDEHRGNAMGGFKYENAEEKEEVEEADGRPDAGQDNA